MESFAFWYWFIAGCICVGPLMMEREAKIGDKILAFLGGFMVLPMLFGVFRDEMWTKNGKKKK